MPNLPLSAKILIKRIHFNAMWPPHPFEMPSIVSWIELPSLWNGNPKIKLRSQQTDRTTDIAH